MGFFLIPWGCNSFCKDEKCQHGGVCEEKTCACTTGYEGDLCELEEREKFIGTYQSDETCTTVISKETGPFMVTFSKSSVPDEISGVLIENFGNYNCSSPYRVHGIVKGKELLIPEQSVCGGYYQFSGSGTFSDKVILLDYTNIYEVSGSIHTDKCSVVLTKQ